LKYSVLAVVTFVWSTAPASAQDAQGIQITPYVALGTEAASPVGAAITFPLTDGLGVETDVAYRRGEGRINALSLSASLLYSLPSIGETTPYLAAGIGLQQYGAPVLSPAGPPIGTQSRLAMTVNAGGGLKIPMSENVGLRTDARWFKAIGKDGNEQFRVAQGISFGVKK
jgi:opacity protein-like surface antigen